MLCLAEVEWRKGIVRSIGVHKGAKVAGEGVALVLGHRELVVTNRIQNAHDTMGDQVENSGIEEARNMQLGEYGLERYLL